MKNSGGSKGGGQPDNPNLQSDRMWAGGSNSFNEAAPNGGMMQPQMGQQSDMMQRDSGWGQGGGGMGGKGDGGMGGMDPAMQSSGGQGNFGGKDGGQPPGMGVRKIGYQGPQQAQMGMMGKMGQDSGFSDQYNAPNPQAAAQAGAAANWGAPSSGINTQTNADLARRGNPEDAAQLLQNVGGNVSQLNQMNNAYGVGGQFYDPQKSADLVRGESGGIGTMIPGIRSQYEAAGRIRNGKWAQKQDVNGNWVPV